MTSSHEDTRTEPLTLPSVSPAIISRRVDGFLSDRPPPVFLHSSFRTGSTWLWQKLRSAPTTLAYYECFNEYLATVTPRQARDVNSFVWDSRHPPGAPYFLEYLPIIEPEGGIAGFDQSIPYRHFVPQTSADGDLEPVDKVHVDRLVSAAWSKMRIPVLTCTRSLGRARALRRSFGGKSIFLHRNLFHQWASYCWQAEAQNTFFINTIRCTINGSAQRSIPPRRLGMVRPRGPRCRSGEALPSFRAVASLPLCDCVRCCRPHHRPGGDRERPIRPRTGRARVVRDDPV